MSAWIIALGIMLTYAGCVLLFQSGQRRARHPAVKVTKEQMKITKPVGWVLIIGALIPLCIPQGVERGIAFWFGAVAAAGSLSLLVSALTPKLHLSSIGIIALISAASAGLF
ncbi:MAG: hypothetical protein AAGG45_08070, partial [Pseudomonadota bacterium]